MKFSIKRNPVQAILWDVEEAKAKGHNHIALRVEDVDQLIANIRELEHRQADLHVVVEHFRHVTLISGDKDARTKSVQELCDAWPGTLKRLREMATGDAMQELPDPGQGKEASKLETECRTYLKALHKAARIRMPEEERASLYERTGVSVVNIDTVSVATLCSATEAYIDALKPYANGDYAMVKLLNGDADAIKIINGVYPHGAN